MILYLIRARFDLLSLLSFVVGHLHLNNANNDLVGYSMYASLLAFSFCYIINGLFRSFALNGDDGIVHKDLMQMIWNPNVNLTC